MASACAGATARGPSRAGIGAAASPSSPNREHGREEIARSAAASSWRTFTEDPSGGNSGRTQLKPRSAPREYWLVREWPCRSEGNRFCHCTFDPLVSTRHCDAVPRALRFDKFACGPSSRGALLQESEHIRSLLKPGRPSWVVEDQWARRRYDQGTQPPAYHQVSATH